MKRVTVTLYTMAVIGMIGFGIGYWCWKYDEGSRVMPEIEHPHVIVSLKFKENPSEKLEEAINNKSVNLDAHWLHLVKNGFEDLPENFSAFKDVFDLNLSDNKFKRIPEVLKTLPKLDRLNLRNNEIGENGLSQLSEMKGIVALDISGNEIKDDDLNVLQELPNLRELSVSSNKITGKGVRLISELSNLTSLEIRNHLNDSKLERISNLKNLKKLDASSNVITNSGIDSITRLENLTELYLSDTDIDLYGLKRLGCLKKLEVLDISNILINTEDEILQALDTVLEISSLKRLYISGDSVPKEKIHEIKKKAEERKLEIFV